jgi:transcriptional regulator with XRE-family HTH domain
MVYTMTDSARTLSAGRLVAFNMTRLRKERGWRQEELGVKFGGWSAASVSAAERSYESKRVKVFDIDEVVTLAGIFGVPIEELLKPVPQCEQCRNSPPEGFTCNTCGRGA